MEYFGKNVSSQFWGGINVKHTVQRGIILTRALRWGINRNDELDTLIKHKNIINYIKDNGKVGLVIYIECQKREWLKKYISGNRC
jgi:hypothetical protein